MPLPADVAQILNQKHTRKIQVGIRPPDIRIASEGDKQAFHATIYSFEPLGTKSILTLEGRRWQLRASIGRWPSDL